MLRFGKIMLRFGKTKFRMLMLIIQLSKSYMKRRIFDQIFNETIQSLVLTLSKMNGYVIIFKDKNNKSMPLHIDDDKLLEKYKTNLTEDLKMIELMLYKLIIEI